MNIATLHNKGKNYTYLFALEDLMFLTWDDFNELFGGLRADGFLTKLAICLAFWSFLLSVNESPFLDVVVGIGVQASFVSMITTE